MKFRKKPIVVEAERMDFTSQNSPNGVCSQAHNGNYGGSHVHTLEGILNVAHGDWIIKGVKGEFYPCKSDIFEATYEKVEDAQA